MYRRDRHRQAASNRRLTLKNFVLKAEDYSSNRKGKRQCLNDAKTGEFRKRLNDHFRTKVKIPRIMKGESQEIETLINEEARAVRNVS